MTDFTTSSNPRFLYFAELRRPFPDWVAAEPSPLAADFEKKSSAAFADTARRLLPISDKVATFHSALDLFAHADDYSSDVFDRVKSACEFFGIEEDIAPYADMFADRLEKSAADSQPDEGRFAIRETLNGTDFTLLPLNDASDVEASAHDLAKMAADRRIHFLMLVPAAQEVVKAASELGVNGLPELIVRLGAERVPNLEKAAGLIAGREAYCKGANQDVIREGYAEALATEDPIEAMCKIAAIDDSIGLRYNYREGARIPLPNEIVFCGPTMFEIEKAAKENVSIGNVLIPLNDMKKIDPTEASFKLSKSAGDGFKACIDSSDARDLSVAVMGWEDADARTLLRLAVAAQ